MLRIALGSEHVKDLLAPDELKRYKDLNKSVFAEYKKREWFRNNFVTRVLKEIDRVEMETDFGVKSLEFNETFSVNDLSGGAQTLILMYSYRKYIYLAQMGENCIDFLEEIAADYEREGKDLTIVSNWLMDFNFKHIDKVYFINWDKTCYNQDQIDDDIFPLWYRQERENENEEDDGPTQDEINAMQKLLESLGINIDNSEDEGI